MQSGNGLLFCIESRTMYVSDPHTSSRSIYVGINCKYSLWAMQVFCSQLEKDHAVSNRYDFPLLNTKADDRFSHHSLRQRAKKKWKWMMMDAFILSNVSFCVPWKKVITWRWVNDAKVVIWTVLNTKCFLNFLIYWTEK